MFERQENSLFVLTEGNVPNTGQGILVLYYIVYLRSQVYNKADIVYEMWSDESSSYVCSGVKGIYCYYCRAPPPEKKTLRHFYAVARAPTQPSEILMALDMISLSGHSSVACHDVSRTVS
jgi:hypothetical protein